MKSSKAKNKKWLRQKVLTLHYLPITTKILITKIFTKIISNPVKKAHLFWQGAPNADDSRAQNLSFHVVF